MSQINPAAFEQLFHMLPTICSELRPALHAVFSDVALPFGKQAFFALVHKLLYPSSRPNSIRSP